MAYALNLNPNKNLTGSMPRPRLDSGTLGIRFYGAANSIRYIVETSEDLEHWTTDGVTLVGPPELRTATVERSDPRRFLRLRVVWFHLVPTGH
jgi:hypothetical protein